MRTPEVSAVRRVADTPASELDSGRYGSQASELTVVALVDAEQDGTFATPFAGAAPGTTSRSGRPRGYQESE
jgi:hypothetical protein